MPTVGRIAAPAAATEHALEFPLAPVELGLPHGLPPAGSRTGQLAVVRETASTRGLSLELEARGGSVHELPWRVHGVTPQAAGGEIANGKLRVRFPAGEGMTRTTVKIAW